MGPLVWGDWAWLVVALVVVTPVAVFVHELGHAFAVKRITGTTPDIHIGRGGREALRVVAPNFALSVSFAGGLDGGFVRFDMRKVTVRQAMIIAFAGPAASFAALVVSVFLLRSTIYGTVGYLLCLAACISYLGGVLNLIPIVRTDKKTGVMRRTDGGWIKLFLRLARAGVPLDTPLAVVTDAGRRANHGRPGTSSPPGSASPSTSIPPPTR